jgi:predicted acyltransferase
VSADETAPSRLVALDAFRGLAVAGMIVVTSPGAWDRGYGQLRHADWNGATLADMVFPAFLFGVGVAIGLSFPRAMGAPAERRLYWWRVARRTMLLILLGLALELTYRWTVALGATGLGQPGVESLRIPGILQRIALCYALAASLAALTAQRDAEGKAHINAGAVAVAIAGLLLLYWALVTFVPVPGYGAGRLDQEGSLAAFIDRAVFTPAHMWQLGGPKWHGPVFYDPEGLLSTLPAATNVLLGMLAALALKRAPDRAIFHIAIAGALFLAAGLLLDPVFPINKKLWTSSFALLSGGFSALLLAALLATLRGDLAVRLSGPLLILGGNAILAFALSTLLGRLYTFPFPGPGGASASPQAWLNARMLDIMPDPWLASLACALLMLALIIFLLWPLHRRAIHLRL